MPLLELANTSSICTALWRITETEEELAKAIAPIEQIPTDLSHPRKRLEFAAGRLLTKMILQKWGQSFEGIRKDPHGKPLLNNLSLNLSLSHSFPFVGAVIDRHNPAGIDIEQPTDKLLRIGPRVLHPEELRDAGQDKVKHCVYWCAKETLMKVYGKRHLVFSENLRVEPFKMSQKGPLSGRIVVNTNAYAVRMQYQIYSEFVVVQTY